MDARRTLERFTAAYAAISGDEALKPGERVSALNRLGMVMQHEGRLAERAELVRRALEIKEGMFGAESTQLTHEARAGVGAAVLYVLSTGDCDTLSRLWRRLFAQVQVLANTLSAIGCGSAEARIITLPQSLRVASAWQCVHSSPVSPRRRNEEALPLMQRALRLAELSRNPKGEPMPHIVAAALGDLGCAAPFMFPARHHARALSAVMRPGPDQCAHPLNPPSSVVWEAGEVRGGDGDVLAIARD